MVASQSESGALRPYTFPATTMGKEAAATAAKVVREPGVPALVPDLEAARYAVEAMTTGHPPRREPDSHTDKEIAFRATSCFAATQDVTPTEPHYVAGGQGHSDADVERVGFGTILLIVVIACGVAFLAGLFVGVQP